MRPGDWSDDDAMERDPLSVIDILFEGALDEDAWRRGLPIDTVRSQLKVIFGKTASVRRRSRCVWC